MPDHAHRFVALDVHKYYMVVGTVDQEHTLRLSPRRVTLAQFPDWAKRHLHPTDQVVLETSVNTWELYDLLVPLVSRVVVADPTQVKVIAASFVKTDKRDTLALAKLRASNLIPEVWVPPVEVRELRALIAHRQRLVEQCTMAKHRLQSLLHRHNLAAPAIDPFGVKHRPWWEA
jgi:transposase